jgi:hypothetical protein
MYKWWGLINMIDDGNEGWNHGWAFDDHGG